MATLGYVEPTAEDCFAQGSTHSFDAATFELWGALTHGAQVVGLAKEVMIAPRELARSLREERISVLYLTAPLFMQTVSQVPEAFEGLRCLLVGGDVVDAGYFRRVLEAGPPQRFLFMYGPTETTVFSSWFLVEEVAPGARSVSIGRPIEATQHYLLDRDLSPVPLGSLGEVYIGGGGVARDYLNRPDLTAERFVPSPFCDRLGEPGARLYRTGDLVRYLPDGRMEFATRTDDQVKLRGFRVEPREIESVLLRHPGVREVRVVVREDVPGDRRLVAYVVERQPGGAGAGDLRSLLAGELPEYMVPSAFVTLASLPLSAHGKLDRRALPAPQGEREVLGAYEAPRTGIEELLASLWSQVLGVERPGIHDDFFDSGGHSLRATQLVSRVRSVFGVDLALRSLFERPTIAELSSELESLLRQGRSLEAPPILPVPRETPLPLSFAQQRLWFIDRLMPGSALYNLPLALGLRGRLDLAVLSASLSAIVERHEVLRTRFVVSAGEPVQRIEPARPISLPLVDLCGLPSGMREATARSLTDLEAARPFDLERGPVLRGLLVRLEPERHRALLGLHHIAADGWSLGVLVRELGELYAAGAEGRAARLPALPVQYADFAVWQRQWLQGEVLERQLGWWREHLEGAPAEVTLPVDRPRPVVPSLRGGQVPVRLGAELSRRLSGLARGQGATLFMALLAGFAALLARLGDQEDLVIGSPVANRNREETEGLIGFFVNTLPLRQEVAGAAGFGELIRRSRETSLMAYLYQDLPFERLLEEIGGERALSRAPLFQVVLVLQNAPVGTLSLPGVALEPAGAELGVAKFDLTLSLGETRDGLSGLLDYSRGLFDAPTAVRMAGQLGTLLSAMAAEPDTAVWDLPLLSEGQRQQLVSEWNDTESVLPSGLVHEQVSAQARRRPEALAVRFGDRSLSYGELETRSNQLAWALRSLGVVRGTRVGLQVDRSEEMVLAILGIWKAGAAYVPLDPAYPADRLAWMMEDSGVTLLLTQERLRGFLHAPDVAWENGGAAPTGATAEDLAYVIYTSGSTGRPKGVLISQRGLGNLAEAQARLFRVVPESRVLQFASPSFDASVSEVVVALAAGAALVLAPREDLLPGSSLLALLREQEITVVTLPPSALSAMPLSAPEDLPKLRTLVLAGEACPPDLARRWAEGRLLLNAYGPTEGTVCATVAPYRGEDQLPLGRAMANVEVHVLDRRANPVPPGGSGELCLGGLGLAWGYLGLPGLTAERFIPHCAARMPGDRLYRTGDLVRILSTGELQLQGRIDRQVKIRGFRIEPGEIETLLVAHPSVREAAVVVRTTPAGDLGLAAYVVAAGDAEVVPGVLREHLRERLPEAMIPAVFVPLPALPLTPNGKIDRGALPDPSGGGTAGRDRIAPLSRVEHVIAALWEEVLGVSDPGVHDNFFDLGGHSLLLVRLHDRLREAGIDVPVQALFRYPTIASLARQVGEAVVASPRRLPRPRRGPSQDSAVAIVGFAFRFPGASNALELWRNLWDGVESISHFAEEELLDAGVDPDLLRSGRYVKSRGMLEGIDLFDAPFFGFTPREAALTDPQHRLFLECAWEALEDAGYEPRAFPGPVGLYAGAGTSLYWLNLLSNPDAVADLDRFQATLGNDKDFLPTRVSYKLNLRGPSLDVQTACSTSLVAVHLACQSLQLGECDLALAGGVSASSRERAGYLYTEGGILSPDGHCRAFAADGRGTVPGSGAGLVVLKRLADAQADGDHIHAVIRGSAINNDGSLKAGYTAPSIQGQAEVIARAFEAAGVGPESVSYVEAHGTGTELGDPVEIEALAEVFRSAGTAGSCGLGSIKTNLGHLDTAAGVAGLIKTVLALENEAIPPSLHFDRPNPRIDLSGSPLFVCDRPRDWKRTGEPRRAGVSSFGIGGTNAHVVLEEAPPVLPSGPSRAWQLLVLSARTETALEQAADNLARHLETSRDVPLADVSYTLQVGRQGFEHRRLVVCSTTGEALEALAGRAPERVLDGFARNARPVAFLFPGQGAQVPGMGKDLYASEPVFRREVDACCEILAPELGLDLRRLFDSPAESAEDAGKAAAILRETRTAQPALFVVEYALARLWMEWGIVPERMIGHSLGEIVAACLAGVFRLEDALSLVALRGRLMQELPGGAMLAVPLPEEETTALLDRELSLAAVNGPARCVVSGPFAAIERLAADLASRDVAVRRLETSHAFHSAMMEPALNDFAAAVGRFHLGRPRLPYISNVTGTWIRESEATDPRYWARHVRETVRFGDGLAALLAEPEVALLEVGPGHTLGTLARRHPAAGPDRPVVCSLEGAGASGSEQKALLEALGRLWVQGAAVSWPGFRAGERRRRVKLPTYPFERRSYWVERKKDAAPAPAPRRKADLADWFYIPSWTRTLPAPPLDEAAFRERGESWLVFADTMGPGARLADRLQELGQEVFRVVPGSRLLRLDETTWTVEPGNTDDCRRLLDELASIRGVPRRIVHAWCLTGGGALHERSSELGFYSLVSLGQALGGSPAGGPLEISVLTDGVHAVTGGEELCPAKALVLGPCRVIPYEIPGVSCRHLDVALSGAWIDDVLAELVAKPEDAEVAFRGPHRLTPSFEPVRLEAPSAPPARLRPQGVYLITGGLGGLGLELAAYLARTVGARLALVGRTGLPGSDERATRLREIEELGGEVLTLQADVSDREALRVAIRRVHETFGPIHGVIHAAGLPASGLLQLQTRSRLAEVLAPKVDGTMALVEALASDPLDFLVLCSSHSAVLGQAGRVDYCAANAFLDAFAQSRSADRRTLTVAVDWDTWRDAGMAFEIARVAGEGAEAGTRGQGLLASEGVEAFARILAHRSPQVLVSPADFRVIRAAHRPASAQEALASLERKSLAKPAHGRPALTVAYAAPTGPVEEALAEIWQRLLGIDRVGIHDNFFELGGDSVLSIYMMARAREAGIELGAALLAEHQTVASLAAAVGTAPSVLARQEEVTGELPLTPIQRWFFEQDVEDGHHWNQSVLLEIREPLAAGALGQALRLLVRHHDALRLRFVGQGAARRQINAGSEAEPPVAHIDLASLPDGLRTRALEAAADQVNASLDLEKGPLFRGVLFDLEAGRPGRLLITAHHLCMDVVSWNILIGDLQRACRRLARREALELPAKTTSFRDWAERLADLATTPAVEAEVAHWTRWEGRPAPLPRDLSGVNTEVSAGRVAAHLAEGDTAKLLDGAKERRLQVDELLLAALARAFRSWTGDGGLLVHLEGHGRPPLFADADVSRTVGWFTSLYPVLLDLDGAGGDPGSTLDAVKERLRATPYGGIHYGLLRYLHASPEVRERLATPFQPEVSFLYAGSLDHVFHDGAPAPLGLARESSGRTRSARALRPHLLDVEARIAGGKLWMSLTFSRNLHRRETIERLAEAWKDEIRILVAHCTDPGPVRYTPADFTKVHLTQEELDDLLDLIGNTGEPRS
ncbi:MAG: amino acid adenylation domain-containing protein [Acidobacteriota bacterium]